MRKRAKSRLMRGLTLIELIITAVIAVIIVFVIGVVLVDSQRDYNRMYERTQGSVATDAYVAQKAFERIVRKASVNNIFIDNPAGATSVTVFYYQDPNATTPDSYATFFRSGPNLLQVSEGPANSTTNPWTLGSATSTTTLATTVQSVSFSYTGACVRMVLTLGDSTRTLTITAAGVRHN